MLGVQPKQKLGLRDVTKGHSMSVSILRQVLILHSEAQEDKYVVLKLLRVLCGPFWNGGWKCFYHMKLLNIRRFER